MARIGHELTIRDDSFWVPWQITWHDRFSEDEVGRV